MNDETCFTSPARAYPLVAPPRFPGAPVIVETAHSYQMPAVTALPDGPDVAAELYWGCLRAAA